jgi:hypothetical protein
LSTDREWAFIGTFTRVLPAYRESTELLGAEKSITIEWVNPVMDALMSAVGDLRTMGGDEAMKGALHLDWKALLGYCNVMKKLVYYVTLFLNPYVTDYNIDRHWPDEEEEAAITVVSSHLVESREIKKNKRRAVNP